MLPGALVAMKFFATKAQRRKGTPGVWSRIDAEIGKSNNINYIYGYNKRF
jgi:hypothetical protein